MRRTGRSLGIAQGVGFGGLLVGGTGLVLSGASRRTVAPFAAIGILGVGSFMLSWVADVYAAFSQGRSRGRPGINTVWELAVGYRSVHDPQFEHDHFGHARFAAWLGQQRLWAAVDVALDRDTQRAELGLARRLLGGTGRASSLEVAIGGSWQRFGADGFSTLTGELSVGGRLDLVTLGPALVGSFVEASLGVGLQALGYESAGSAIAQDVNAMLLARVGYGVYVGRTGEVVFAYDHRRDGLEGGLSLDSVAAGNLGSLSLTGRGWFPRAPRWGVELSATVGSAWILGASVLVRGEEAAR